MLQFSDKNIVVILTRAIWEFGYQGIPVHTGVTAFSLKSLVLPAVTIGPVLIQLHVSSVAC